MSVAWVGVGVAAAGALSQASAASSAADAQQEATRSANDLQRYQFDRNTELQMPTINTGNAARDRLSYLLGLSPTGYSGTGGVSGTSSTQPLTYDQLRTQLLGQFTRTTPGTAGPATMDQGESSQQMAQASMGPVGFQRPQPEATSGGSTIDEAGLDAAIRARLADQEAQQRAAVAAAQNDPNYGRLAQQFQFDTYTPEKFSYTGEDLYKDPSYLFRLQQGQKALDNSGAAAGRFLSGRQLQASSDYNQGAASQEFQSAYQRALGTFGTNEGNRYQAFNTNQGNRFNAYQANFNNAVNPLLSLSGAATLGSQNLGNAGAAYAGQVGNNLTNQANATGAAGIASANSISSGLNNAVGGYQQNQLMQQLINRNNGVNNNPTSSYIDGLGASNNFWGTGTGGTS
jgi:hypothetical protein